MSSRKNAPGYVKWPPFDQELYDLNVAREAARIPNDHVTVLRAISNGYDCPRVWEIAKDAHLPLDHTRSCLRNLREQGMASLTTFIKEDYQGYFGCGYIQTNFGRAVLRKLKLEVPDEYW